jgi:hypothetical protein
VIVYRPGQCGCGRSVFQETQAGKWWVDTLVPDGHEMQICPACPDILLINGNIARRYPDEDEEADPADE